MPLVHESWPETADLGSVFRPNIRDARPIWATGADVRLCPSSRKEGVFQVVFQQETRTVADIDS